MSALERRIGRWPEVIGDLLMHDLTEFPRQVISEAIADDFGSAVAWNWMDADDIGFELHAPLPGWPPPDLVAFLEHEGVGFHPLIRWFVSTGCPSPMSTGRVPRTIAPERCFALLRACMWPTDLDQQLSIPYRMAGHQHRSFVLARAGADFCDEDLEVARRLQPLLVLLERQVQVLRRAAPSPAPLGPSLLTGRERAVLVLLDRGCTAEAIAHELGISPRTVQKHLEHLYRKLGVGDRLRAVAVAREAHLLAGHVPEQRREESGPAGSESACPELTRWSGRRPSRGTDTGALSR